MTLYGPTLTRWPAEPCDGRPHYTGRSHYRARHTAWQARQRAQGADSSTAAWKAWLDKRRARKAARAARKGQR